MTNRLQLASVVDTFTTPPLQMLVIQTAWANRQLFAALRAVEAFETQKGADLIVRAQFGMMPIQGLGSVRWRTLD